VIKMPAHFYFLFSGKYQDGLFHFFYVDEDGTERELEKMNFWKIVDYMGIKFPFGHNSEE